MGTSRQFIEYVLEQADLGESLTFRKMFGEYALYHDGKVVGLVCDNSVYVKPTPATQALARSLPKGPPYPGAKEYAIADELLDAPEALRKLLVATSAALPVPKPKKPRSSRS